MITLEIYIEYCKEQNLPFEEISSVKSYNNSTLFCIAGMQKYKNFFSKKEKPQDMIITNSQAVLRCDDINEISDNTHYLYFNMLGYFDFREKKRFENIKKLFNSKTITTQERMNQAVFFWYCFVLLLKVDASLTFKAHPKLIKGIKALMHGYKVEPDKNLTWTDGEITGCCVEFYIHNGTEEVEIGNIVMYDNGMIDCGFGLERLEMFANKNYKKQSDLEILIETAKKIIETGVRITSGSRKKHQHVLYDILKRIGKMEKNFTKEHDESFLNDFKKVMDSIVKNKERYLKLKDKPKYKEYTAERWKDEFGISIDDL